MSGTDYNKFNNYKYQVGDIVILRTGTASQKIIKITYVDGIVYLQTRYLRSEPYGTDYDARARPALDYYPAFPDPNRNGKEKNSSKKEKKMSKLYKTADGRYGTLLTQDSKGNYILEMSGNGGVLPFDPKELEVVRPYTVRCVTLTPVAGKNNCVSHYRAKQGSVKVGDVVVTSSNVLVRVTSVDTKTDTEAVLDGVVLDSRPLEALFDIDEE